MTSKPARKRISTNTAYLRFVATFIAVILAAQTIYATRDGLFLVIASAGVSVILIALVKLFERRDG